MAFEIADREPAPALRCADQGGKHELHRGLLIEESRNDLGAATFLNEGSFNEVGSPHVDAMAHRYPMDRQQRLEVVGEACHRGWELSAIPVDDPIRLRPRRTQRGGIPDGTNFSHHLRHRIVGELGPNVPQAMEPATGPPATTAATPRAITRRINAPRFGWINPDWARCGQPGSEPWHWEYVGSELIAPTGEEGLLPESREEETT